MVRFAGVGVVPARALVMSTEAEIAPTASNAATAAASSSLNPPSLVLRRLGTGRDRAHVARAILAQSIALAQLSRPRSRTAAVSQLLQRARSRPGVFAPQVPLRACRGGSRPGKVPETKIAPSMTIDTRDGISARRGPENTTLNADLTSRPVTNTCQARAACIRGPRCPPTRSSRRRAPSQRREARADLTDSLSLSVDRLRHR